MPALGQPSPYCSKYSVINTLACRPKTVCSILGLLRTKQQYLMNGGPNQCKYPTLALDRMEQKNFQKNKPSNKHQQQH